MDYVVTVDDRGRVLLPVDVRRRLGLRKGSKLILRVVEGGRLEAIPLERELERVAEVFKKNLRAGGKRTTRLRPSCSGAR
uniref:AbrB/MazE/SpoVT family DNA-binding domain-containing protein n=1 Tax=Thermofilum pendens TaxID=2269 RepID=A0A7C3WLE9_THEPE